VAKDCPSMNQCHIKKLLKIGEALMASPKRNYLLYAY